MELKASVIATLVVLLLLFPGQSFSRGNLHVNKNMGSEIYEIDYRGPETHTYLPPPNRAAGDRPRVHHKTTVARRHKSKPINNGKKIMG